MRGWFRKWKNMKSDAPRDGRLIMFTNANGRPRFSGKHWIVWRRNARSPGKAPLFDCLKPYLSATGEAAVPYEEMAPRLHRPVATLRSDVARLRAHYRAILREEVRGTVAPSFRGG